MTTTIFFDVDGVFNACPAKDTTLTRAGWDEWVEVSVKHTRIKRNGYPKTKTYPILFAPELVEMVNEIAARPDVEVRWLTTWCDQAASRIAPAIGLNGESWTVTGVASDVDHEAKIWWKSHLLKDAVAQLDSPRIVWVDDDLPFYYGSSVVEWHKKDLKNRYLVATDTTLGITREDLAGILEFLG